MLFDGGMGGSGDDAGPEGCTLTGKDGDMADLGQVMVLRAQGQLTFDGTGIKGHEPPDGRRGDEIIICDGDDLHGAGDLGRVGRGQGGTDIGLPETGAGAPAAPLSVDIGRQVRADTHGTAGQIAANGIGKAGQAVPAPGGKGAVGPGMISKGDKAAGDGDDTGNTFHGMKAKHGAAKGMANDPQGGIGQVFAQGCKGCGLIGQAPDLQAGLGLAQRGGPGGSEIAVVIGKASIALGG